MTDTIYALLAIAMVLMVVSLLVPVAERFRLPHTVLLAIAGMGLGFLGSWVIGGHLGLGAVDDAFVGLDKLEVGTDMFLPLFLPPLLFTAGLTIDVRRLMDEISAVLLLAIVAVLVCIACVAGVVHLATGMDLVVCLLLGAVVSTTDPAAVIGIFRDVGAPKRLSILAEGEALLNDAVAIAAFGLFIGILASRSIVDPIAVAESDPSSAVGVFLRFPGLRFLFPRPDGAWIERTLIRRIAPHRFGTHEFAPQPAGREQGHAGKHGQNGTHHFSFSFHAATCSRTRTGAVPP